MKIMKRQIKKLVPFILILTLLVSCKKNLEEYNPSGTPVETSLNTPEGLEAAINASYTYNRNLYGKEEGYALLEAGTDIWTNGANNGNTGINGIFPNTPLTTYQGLIADNTWVNTALWVPCYAGINLCNTALTYVTTSGLSDARRPTAEAELRFMRAWYYWHLVESFGDIPFTLEPTDSKNIVTTATRTPVEKVYEQIFADVNFAAANLASTSSDYGRVTKPAAEAFLAKLFLTRGKNQEASNYANKVIKSYNFSLLANYSDLWDITKEKNSEVVWALNYSTTLTHNAGSNLGHSMFLMDYTDLPGMKRDLVNGLANVRYMPTLFLLNLFNENNDARYSASFTSTWVANNAATIPKWTVAEAANNASVLGPLVGKNKFEVGDTAVFVSKHPIDDFDQKYSTHYRYRTYDVNDVYNANGTAKDRFHYLSLKKFNDPKRPSATEGQSARDVYFFRLADMYLIAAEAQQKLGKLDSAAFFLNAVRKRAALPGKQDAMNVLPATITLDFILDERAREFAGEQMRWFDLKRAGKLVSRVKEHNPDLAPNIMDFHALRPIPQAQLSAVTNKAEFKQNPGY